MAPVPQHEEWLMSELSDSFIHSLEEFSGARVDNHRAIAMTHLATPGAVGLSEAHTLIAGLVMIETISVLEGDTLSILNSVSEMPDYVTDVRVAFDVAPPFAHYVFTNPVDQDRFMSEVLAGIDYSV